LKLILSKSAGKSKDFPEKNGLDFGKNIRFQEQNARGRTAVKGIEKRRRKGGFFE